jgi:hypothetical protein
MSKGTYPLKLPASIQAAAARLAKEDGVSLNPWIASAVAPKVGAVETAATFFKNVRAAHESGICVPSLPWCLTEHPTRATNCRRSRDDGSEVGIAAWQQDAFAA